METKGIYILMSEMYIQKQIVNCQWLVMYYSEARPILHSSRTLGVLIVISLNQDKFFRNQFFHCFSCPLEKLDFSFLASHVMNKSGHEMHFIGFHSPE